MTSLSPDVGVASAPSSIPKKIICIGDILAAPIYIVLVIVALLSVGVPVLRDLSAHGKTRIGAHNDHSHNNNNGIPWKFLDRLSSDVLLVRKRNFLQFYVAGIAVTLLLFILRRMEDQMYASPVESHREFGLQGFAVALLMMHLTRRCYECLYVHEWAEGSKMHAAGFALGLLHYIVLPFVFLGSDGDHDWCCEFSNPGEQQVPQEPGGQVSADEPAGDDQKSLGGKATIMVTIAGAALVMLGQAEQHRDHRILGDLRRSSFVRDGKTESRNSRHEKDCSVSTYHIPVGGFFHYISSPHYLAEIVIYAGFALLLHYSRAPYHDVKCNLSSSVIGQLTYGIAKSGSVHIALNIALKLEEYKHIALLVWVVTNLSISAMRNHAWYRREFGDKYPRRRKVLVPLLW